MVIANTDTDQWSTLENQEAQYRGRRGARRFAARRQGGRLKKTPQDNTPADVRVVILVLVGFLAALFLVTKLALGL